MKTVALKVFLLFVVCTTGQRISTYKEQGIAFVKQYYLLFDSVQRPSVRDFYENVDSILVYGDSMYLGADAIMQKYATSTTVGQRNISATDCQPTNDAGIIINVVGKLSFNDSGLNERSRTLNSTLWFNEMFVLKPRVTAFFIQNQHFRSSVWNISSASMNYSDVLIFV
jgi:hypothetical protein